MAYNLDLLPEAKQELDSILYYYEIISSNLQKEFAYHYAKLVDRMCENPHQFPYYQKKYKKARFVGTFNKYHIIFKVYPNNTILIIAIAHDKRRPFYWGDRT